MDVAGLTREGIVRAALRLLAEVGYDGLTTRRLAQELRVKQPALYWHFKSKRQLADALAAAMLSSEVWPGPATPGLAPEDWLAARAHAFRRALLAHRDGAAIHAGTTPDAALLPSLDRQVLSLIEHGLSPDDALRTLLAISRYTVGWVLEEQAQTGRDDVGTIKPDVSSAPSPPRAGVVVDQRDPDADFDFGLKALIAGAMQHRHAHTKS